MMRGIIKTLKNGFGFITPEGAGSKDLFFHATEVQGEFNDLRQGDTVTFVEIPSDRGGMKAGKVTKASADAGVSEDSDTSEDSEDLEA